MLFSFGLYLSGLHLFSFSEWGAGSLRVSKTSIEMEINVQSHNAYMGGLPAGWEIVTERQDDLCGLLHQEHKGAQGSMTQKSVRGTKLRGQHPQTPRKTVSSFACPKTRDWKASDGHSRGTLR